MKTKQEIRNEIRKMREQLTREYIDTKSGIIQDKLFDMEEYIKAECIFIYMSMNGEVDTTNIILRAFKDGKRVAVPKIENGKMQFYHINSLSDTRIGYFGIQEPITAEPAHIKEVDNCLMVMPGIAFDKQKNRVGYGKGFYDKYLQTINTKKIAIAFDFQILDQVPYTDYDILVNKIITEKRDI